MALMAWNNTWNLGVGPMDGQHRGLIDAMNRLHERSEAGARPAEVLELMDELFRLAGQHFSQEETFMESFDYPDLAKHKMIHQTLMDRLAAHRTEMAQTHRASEEFFDFLKFWLVSHICSIDTKYAAVHQTA